MLNRAANQVKTITLSTTFQSVTNSSSDDMLRIGSLGTYESV
jgi:hypothetical protein